MQNDRVDRDPEVLNLITGHFHEGPAYRSFRPNGSASWLLILTLAGSGRFGGERETIVQPGDWVLMRPRCRHEYQTFGDQWELLWCHFHPRMHWLPWLRWKERSPGLMMETSLVQDDFVRIFRECHRYASQSEIHSDSLAMNALEAVILHIDQERRTTRAKLDPRVEAALAYASSHLTEAISLDELAASVGLSVSRLSHLFQAEMGAAPREFVERMRLDRAAGLLKLTELTVKSIAAQVGFDNPFYFTLRFKRHTGLSPTAFRQNALEKAD